MTTLLGIWLIVRYGYAKGALNYLEAHRRGSLQLFMKKKSLELLKSLPILLLLPFNALLDLCFKYLLILCMFHFPGS